jgi:S1-C subfamily serine protease
MQNIKFGALFLGLTLTVAAAISAAAQDRVEPRRDIQVLGQGGSQLGIRVSDTANGVRVDDVDAGSPADKAGIREGDVVVEFDGERVRSAMQLTRLVRETPNGRAVPVAVMRDGKRQALKATPEAGRSFAFDDDAMREMERGLRNLPREFRVVPPVYRYDNPRRFEYRLPDGWAEPFMGSRGRLGVTVQSLTPDLEEYFGATNGGALVSSVAQDSAAARAGLKAGDVITSINGRQVSGSDDLMRELRDLTGEVTIVVLRDKKEMTLKGTLRPRQ